MSYLSILVPSSYGPVIRADEGKRWSYACDCTVLVDTRMGPRRLGLGETHLKDLLFISTHTIIHHAAYLSVYTAAGVAFRIALEVSRSS